MAAVDKPQINIVEVGGHPFVGGRLRQLCFLEMNGNKFVSAGTVFPDLDPASAKGLRHSFTLWLQNAANARKHHGWEPSVQGGRYVNCYVFKHYDGSRVYGFKFNPSAGRSQLCCLVHCTAKHQDGTEFPILDEIVRLRADPKICAALEKFWNVMTAETGKL